MADYFTPKDLAQQQLLIELLKVNDTLLQGRIVMIFEAKVIFS